MNFDEVIKLCCKKFCNPNSAKAKDADIKQFIVRWWNDHKYLMDVHSSRESLLKLMELKNLASISAYTHTRIPTYDYDKNTKLVKQWLFDITLEIKMYREKTCEA